jgi:hypothetical protein
MNNERRKLTEAEVERACVEELTGLTGGELSDDPWEGTAGGSPVRAGSTFRRTYNFEGAPEWLDEIGKKERYSGEWATAVHFGAVGSPAKFIFDRSGTWELEHALYDDPEHECMLCHWDPEKQEESSKPRPVTEAEAQIAEGDDRRCPYCEEAIGEEHGFLYQGNATWEVYRHKWTFRVEKQEDGSLHVFSTDPDTKQAIWSWADGGSAISLYGAEVNEEDRKRNRDHCEWKWQIPADAAERAVLNFQATLDDPDRFEAGEDELTIYASLVEAFALALASEA